jgi:hypothetical protein
MQGKIESGFSSQELQKTLRAFDLVTVQQMFALSLSLSLSLLQVRVRSDAHAKRLAVVWDCACAFECKVVPHF